MKFVSELSLKNIRRRPFRSAMLAALVMLLAFTLFAGGIVIFSLQNGLASYRARLGADIVVVPASATGHGAVDDILLQGITGNYYMTGRDCEKVKATDGIAAVTTQFFLTSAKASCCSTRVQIIGFDPQTDFSIQPWIAQSYTDGISDGEVIVGANINIPASGAVTFYGQDYPVAAQLAKTGTGLDSTVYANMSTVKQMAANAARLLDTGPFQGVNINTAVSAVLIRVADGYEISSVADDINIHITKVQASPARSMISDLSAGLGSVSRLIGGLVAAIWVLAVGILLTVLALLSNERRKEFAVLRVMGASQKLLVNVMSMETAIVSACGAALGLLLAALVVFSLSETLQSALGLPFLMPKTGAVLGLAGGVLVLTVSVGLLTAVLSARRITNSETGLLLREDA